MHARANTAAGWHGADCHSFIQLPILERATKVSNERAVL